MKTLYQAANAVEAHMILHLLKQEGITGHVLGEHLQGAIGELPAAGLVRVTVDEADYERGRALIAAWEASMPMDAGAASSPPAGHAHGRGRGWKMLLLGLSLGIAGAYGALRVPARQQTIDHNSDGHPDETWTSAIDGTMLRYESDRNGDRKPDYIARYGRGGLLTQAQADEDFDGVMETKIAFIDNQPDLMEADADGDGYPEMVTVCRHGVAVEVRYLAPLTGQPLRVEYLRLGKITHADVDADRDGQLETRWRYGSLGEVVSTERLKPAETPMLSEP